NVSRKNNDVALFEVGRVFVAANDAIREERRLAIALTGQRHPGFWTGEARDARFDVFDLKGLLEEFFEQFGVRGVNYVRRPESTALFLESATVQLGKPLPRNAGFIRQGPGSAAAPGPVALPTEVGVPNLL